MTHPNTLLTKLSNSKRTVVSLVAVAAFSLGAMPAANALTDSTATDSGRVATSTQTNAGGEWHDGRYDMGRMHHDGLQGGWYDRSSSGSIGLNLGVAADADYQNSEKRSNHDSSNSSGSLGADVNAGVQATGQSTSQEGYNTEDASSEGSAQAAVGAGVEAQGSSQTSNENRGTRDHHNTSNSGSLNTGLNLNLNLGGNSSNRDGGLLGL